MNPLFSPFVVFNLNLQYSANIDNLLDITTHGIAPKDFTAHTIAVLQYCRIASIRKHTLYRSSNTLKQYDQKTRRIAVRIKDI